MNDILRGLSVSMGTTLLIRENEEYAELHIGGMNKAISPREAVVRLAVHSPGFWEPLRERGYQAPEAA
jgi:hypothetical protein